jgi:hypothetical protein
VEDVNVECSGKE